MTNSFNFKSIDLFGINIPISYENNYFYKTNVGATLTIISFIVIIFYTIFQISTLLDRSSYTVITSETQDPGGKIDLSNIPIMFQLLDLLWNPVEFDPKLFVLTVTFTEATFQTVDGEKKRVTNIKNLEIDRCDKLKKEFKILNEFSEYNLTKYICIKPNQNLSLYGSPDDVHNDLKSLAIRVSKCKNQLNDKCSDSNMINNLIENRIFAFTYLGYAANFSNINSNKNVEYKTYTNYIYLSKHFKKAVTYRFSECKLNLFDNFFVTYKTEINYFYQKEYVQDFTFIENITNYSDDLVRFDIIYSGYLTEYTKNIKGIGPIFSYIMATFNTVIIVARFINDYYGNKILLSDIFQFLKNKNINFRNLNKYKSSKENDISNNELIYKNPINNNYGSGPKKKLIFNVNNSSKQINNPIPSIKFRDKQKTSNYRHTKKDYLKFCIYPYCLIKRNQQLYNIKDDICSLFSVENILETIKSIGSLHSLKSEFYDQAIENKMIADNCSKMREFNDFESKSNIKIHNFSRVMNDK